jgi:hypothetical protein
MRLCAKILVFGQSLFNHNFPSITAKTPKKSVSKAESAAIIVFSNKLELFDKTGS